MALIGAIRDTRKEGPPIDTGGWIFPSTAVAFRYTFSGATLYAVIRVGPRGWSLVGVPTVAPETSINASFAALGVGTRIVILDATYTLATLGISFTANQQVLEGMGRGSFIDGNALPTTVHAINIVAFTDCVVRNLSVQTQGGGGKTCECIRIANAADRFLIDCVTIVNSDDHGIHLDSPATSRGNILDCVVLAADSSNIYFNTSSSSSITVSNCKCVGSIYSELGNSANNVDHCISSSISLRGNCSSWVIDSNVTNGINMVHLAGIQPTSCLISNNRAVSSGGIGIQVGGDNLSNQNMVIGNFVSSCTLSGISTKGNDRVYVLNNLSYNNRQHGIYIENNPNSIIAGNISVNNDSNNTASYDGIVVTVASDYLIASNYCYLNHRYGIIVVSPRTLLVGNFCISNDRHGIYISGSNCQASGNYCYHNGVDANNTYDGIYLSSSLNTALMGNYCIGDKTRQRRGINLESGSNYCSIIGNYVSLQADSGIVTVANSDLIDLNYCYDNVGYGISILGGATSNKIGRGNMLVDNDTAPFSDAGTGTVLPTLVFQFQQGGDATGIIVAQFISADASAKGWEIDAADEWTIALGHLPLEVQQVVRIKVWAVGLAAPGAGNRMVMELLANGAQSDEPFNTENISVPNKTSNEVNFAVNDVISWVFTSADDADIGDLIGGDDMEFKAKHNATVGADIATDAVFRNVEVEYV